MATGVDVFTSGDASAPQLYGSSGSLVAVLDACLVNGYGSKNPAGYGGAGAWGITYTASGKRVYRPSAGNRFYVRVRDDAGGTGGAKEALIRGAEAWTDVDTVNTGPMPTDAQSALTDHSLIIRKSFTADSITGRPWIVAADDRTFYLFISTGDAANTYLGVMWGDIYSDLASDGYRTMIIARAAENSGTNTTDTLDVGSTPNTTARAGHFIQRTYATSGGSITSTKGPMPNVGTISQRSGCTTDYSIAYPNAPGANCYILPNMVHELTPYIRGRMRGLWFLPMAHTNLNDGDTFAGTGDLAGRTFRIIKLSGNVGAYVIETSDTWDTSS